MDKKNFNLNDDLDIIIDGEDLPLVIDDIYSVMFIRHEKKFMFGGFKTYLWFKIITQCEYFGIELFKAYNTSKKMSRRYGLCKDIEIILGRKLQDKEKPKIEYFKNKVLKVKTRTVTKDCKQRELADFHKYSVIDYIIEVETGTNA